MKAIELLKDYRNIDFGCDVEQLHSDIDEAIAELEALEAKHKEELKQAWIDGSNANYKAMKEAGKLK